MSENAIERINSKFSLYNYQERLLKFIKVYLNMTILKNSNWSKTNKKNILSDKNIDPKKLSFKFYEENIENQNHLFLTYQQEKKKFTFTLFFTKKKDYSFWTHLLRFYYTKFKFKLLLK